jgi:cysteine desulfurase
VRVYLDWNATTPPLPEVIDAVARASKETWGNPESVHGHGRAARSIVEDARAAVAELAGADPRDVVFTSGGTEANNLAITTWLRSGGALLTSRLEHPSITKLADRHETRFVRVLPDGRIDLAHLEEELARGGIACVAVQAVNQETGVLQPVQEAIALAHRAGAKAHVDAVQAWGKIAETGVGADSRSLAAHKLRGPKGIGALVLAPFAKVEPLAVGGGQERGMRPGTVDAALSAGLGVCARHARTGPDRYAAIGALRDILEQALVRRSAVVNGTAPRAPHVLSIAFEEWNGPELVAALDLEGISISSGSACSAGTMEPPTVVAAMLGEKRARSSVRISLGETTSTGDLEQVRNAFERVLERG